jgi:hypothetical protein
MTNTLENSLVMVVLAALIFIPVFMIRRNSKKKKQDLIQKQLDKISSDNNFKITRTNSIGNLLIAYSDNRRLLLLHLIDLTYELINLEKIVKVEDEITYNGKEVKTVKLILSSHNASIREILLYKQFENSESILSAAKKLAIELSMFINSSSQKTELIL